VVAVFDGNPMSTVLALLLVSAIVGFLIGLLGYRVFAIALVAPIIAVAAAVKLRDFHLVPAVAITFASLLVNQIAYLIGFWLVNRSISDQSDDHIGGDC
jgi:hypothetical protein